MNKVLVLFIAMALSTLMLQANQDKVADTVSSIDADTVKAELTQAIEDENSTELELQKVND